MEVSCIIIANKDLITYMKNFISILSYKKTLQLSFIRKKVKDKVENIKVTAKRPEIYKPFRFLIVIFGLLELSGFAVLANYSIIMVEVRSYNRTVNYVSLFIISNKFECFVE